ncbi:MAG TPA: UrcA family protein [Caulobacteraceae bacterium]|jgi:UrcA family protein|nr:UrcA family protein [Caulobacteraceae bacterium]
MRALTVAVAATCLLAGAVAGQVQAADRDASAERLVVGNVDFRDAGQVRAFHKRLQQAALFVCGVSSEADREQREADRACAEKAVRDAVNSLDRPLLTATYQQAGAPMIARGY